MVTSAHRASAGGLTHTPLLPFGLGLHSTVILAGIRFQRRLIRGAVNADVRCLNRVLGSFANFLGAVLQGPELRECRATCEAERGNYQ